MDSVLLLIRAAALYLPIFVAFDLWVWRRPGHTERVALLLSFVWNLPALFLVHMWSQYAGFWTFEAEGGTFYGMPVDFYLGWAVLWGPIPLLAFPRLPLFLVACIMGVIDVVCMPLLSPVLQLGEGWLIGEAGAILIALIPAQLLGRWTRDTNNLHARATAQAMCFIGLAVVLLPALVFDATGGSLSAVFNRSLWGNVLWLQVLAWPAVIGLSAVQEFAQQGKGTPFPFDPPKYLVISGVYRYVRNPMQLSLTLMMCLMAIWLHNYWFMGVAGLAIVYSAGFAEWSEADDLRERFGASWLDYKNEARNWRPRLSPYLAQTSTLYVAQSCDPCSQLGATIARLRPQGLTIVPAEKHPSRDLVRITYESSDGRMQEEGVAAIARTLEHVSLSWALLGAFIRLPLVGWGLQLITDAVGGGPRKICRIETG